MPGARSPTSTHRPGDADPLPAYDLIATLGDTSFVWWFVFLALVLQYTPPGPREGRLATRLPAVTVLTGVVFQVLALLRSTPLDPPREDLVSPWAVEALRRPAQNGRRPGHLLPRDMPPAVGVPARAGVAAVER